MVLDDGQGWIDGAEIPANHPLVDSGNGRYGQGPRVQTKIGGFTGGTDAPYFQTIARTPTISAFGPGLLSMAHGPNERVPVDDLISSAKIYALAALGYLR